MKRQTAKVFAAALTVVLLICSIACSAWGKTIQERFEDAVADMRARTGNSSGSPAGLAQSESTTQASTPSNGELGERLRGLFNQMQNSDNAQVREEIMNIIRSFGIDVDFENITDTDIGKIIEGIGDNSALSQLIGLGQEAFASGTDMLRDVFGDRLGTSFGSNTLDNTTREQTTSNRPSPTLPAIVTQPVTQVIAPSTQLVAQTQPPTTPAAPATLQNAGQYGENAAPIVAPDAQTAPQRAPAQKMDQSSMVVLLILSVATVGVIVAVVIFVIVKKRR